MKVLVIQTAFIGDAILATALVEKLREKYPEAQIDMVVRLGNEPLLQGNPHLRKVWSWNKNEEKYVGLFHLARQLRRERYDWAVNCQRFAASGLMTLFSGARRTVGFDKNPLSLFFTKRVPHRFGDARHFIHETDRNQALIAHLTDARAAKPRLYPSAPDRARAHALAEGKSYVCIAPTSVWHTKQWPAHKWIALIDRLPANHRVFLLGAPGDTEACEQIRLSAARKDVVNLCGQLHFLESAALMEGAAMNYVNDSAPLHIASAVNAPVTAVFCSTLPAFGFTPLSDESHVVETQLSLDCRPCGIHGKTACPKGHFKCAESIEIEGLILG